jgi:regulator of protease activity HflC (stomatin/prohibitin superfamily)
MLIHVQLNERVFVHINGRPERYLTPGRYRVFRPFSNVELVRANTDQILADLRPEQLALVPAEDLTLISLAENQRAVVMRRGRAARWLGVGEHQVWTVDRRVLKSALGTRDVSNVSIEIFDTSSIEAVPLRDDIRALAPANDYVEATAAQGTTVLRYVDGVLDAELPPGRHAAWTTSRKVNFAVIDLREKLLHITGQEVMTKDKVTLRLNVSVQYRVADAKRLATVAREPDDVLYLAVQLAAREQIATRTLDELLASRDAIAGAISPAVGERATGIGLSVITFGVKDVVLPGDMKELMNRVIEAQKVAEANVITRREEIAAVRSMAQTAKVLSENPLLLRMKELEAYKELAGKVEKLHVVLGDTGVNKLQLGM